MILGDGILGEEMIEIAERVNRREPAWNLLGYLTLAPNHMEIKPNGYPVLGDVKAFDRFPEATFVMDNECPHELLLPDDRRVALCDPCRPFHAIHSCRKPLR